MNSIPSFTFDTANLPQHERFDAYAAAIEPLFDPGRPAGTPLDSNWSCTYWEVGPLIFCSHDLGPLRVNRGPQHIERSNDRHVLLRIVEDGEIRHESTDERALIQPGAIHLFDISQPFIKTQQVRSRGKSVFIPHRLLGLDKASRSHLGALATNEPIGAMLAAAANAVFCHVQSMSPDDTKRVSEGFTALVRQAAYGAPRRKLEASGARAYASHRVLAYIERNVLDPKLSIEAICRDLRMSRSTVFRALAGSGGVARAIKDHKLLAAMDELSSSSPTSGRIGLIADRFGFATQSNFSREFKAKFGVSPRDVAARGGYDGRRECRETRRAGAAGAGVTTASTGFIKWLKSGPKSSLSSG